MSDQIIDAEVVASERVPVGKTSCELAIVLKDDGTVDLNEVAVREDVARFLAEFDTPQITDRKSYQQAKRDRTALNARSKELNAQRLATIKDIKAMLDGLKSKVDDIIEPIDELSEQFKDAIDAYERELKAKRARALRDHYDTYAGFLVDRLPYERVSEDAWLNQSTPLEAALQAIEDKVGHIAKDDSTIDETLAEMGLERFSVQVRDRYFETLDLGAAITRAHELKKQEDATAEFERKKAALAAEREAAEAARVEAQRQAEAARQEREEEARRAAAAAQASAQVAPVPEAIAPPQAPATPPQAQETTQAPVRASEAPLVPTAASPDAEPVFLWRFEFEATERAAKAVANVMRVHRIKSANGKGFENLGRKNG